MKLLPVAEVVALLLVLPAAAHASLIGDAHRAINAAFQSRADGYEHGRITACRRVTRAAVDCDVLLTDPVPVSASCQGGAQASTVSVGICETPQDPTRTSEVVTLRVRRGRVYRLASL